MRLHTLSCLMAYTYVCVRGSGRSMRKRNFGIRMSPTRYVGNRNAYCNSFWAVISAQSAFVAI